MFASRLVTKERGRMGGGVRRAIEAQRESGPSDDREEEERRPQVRRRSRFVIAPDTTAELRCLQGWEMRAKTNAPSKRSKSDKAEEEAEFAGRPTQTTAGVSPLSDPL